jgi:hypothetical protein
LPSSEPCRPNCTAALRLQRAAVATRCVERRRSTPRCVATRCAAAAARWFAWQHAQRALPGGERDSKQNA